MLVEQRRADRIGADIGIAKPDIDILADPVAGQRSQQQLAQTMRDIASSSSQVANASREISMGNLDLSHRTEQQAISLEQTNKNVQHMAEIAKRYADSAVQAARLSSAADKAAQHGGEVVSNVVSTMEQINQSTQAIHANISVIQSIAFQTNILALNAAVEAAHAGEQGRGFAVVASEVRALAQRTGAAAKEIRALIEESRERVEVGGQRADEAKRRMDEVMQAVSRVSGVLEQINSAAREQAIGVGQVSEAVQHLDTITQQNAAMVEELAASASSLNDQVGRVHSAIRVFRLMPHDKSLAEVSAVDLRKQHREAAPAPAAPSKASAPGSATPAPSARPAPKPAPKLASRPAIKPAVPPQPATRPAAPLATAAVDSDDDWQSF